MQQQENYEKTPLIIYPDFGRIESGEKYPIILFYDNKIEFRKVDSLSDFGREIKIRLTLDPLISTSRQSRKVFVFGIGANLSLITELEKAGVIFNKLTGDGNIDNL